MKKLSTLTALLALSTLSLAGCSDPFGPDQGKIKQEFISRGFTKPTTRGTGHDWNLGVGTCRIYVGVSDTGGSISYRTDKGTVVKDITAAKLLALPEFSYCRG